MHIQSYLGEFNSFTSNQKRKVQNIFSNLNRSRKSLSKVYEQTGNNNYEDKCYSFSKKSLPSKRQQYAFDDNLFHPLYRSNLRTSHQRNNTISAKVDVSKLSFKLNYVQNHRPIIKQKIINKVKEKQDSFNINFLTEPKTQLKIDTKRSKIEKFIRNNKDSTQGNEFIRSRKTNKISIKDVFSKMQQGKISSDTHINQYQSLPARRIQSSNTHYDFNCQQNKGSPVNRYHSPQKSKEKSLIPSQLPDYAKNIMKPCKIQGMQLLNRPLSVGFKRNSSGLGINAVKLREESIKAKGTSDNVEWSVRMIKTARQGSRQRKYRNLDSQTAQSFQKQKGTQKKLLQLQPWNNDINNQEQQQQLIIFNHQTVN